jgi:hypothetical protein
MPSLWPDLTIAESSEISVRVNCGFERRLELSYSKLSRHVTTLDRLVLTS